MDLGFKRKIVRRCKFSPETKRKKKQEANKLHHEKTIYLKNAFSKWLNLRNELKVTNDELALFLIDFYNTYQSDRLNSNLITNSVERIPKTKVKSENLAEGNFSENSGLPLDQDNSVSCPAQLLSHSAQSATLSTQFPHLKPSSPLSHFSTDSGSSSSDDEPITVVVPASDINKVIESKSEDILAQYHLMMQERKKTICFFCLKAFEMVGETLNHVCEVHKQLTFQCLLCGFQCPNFSQLRSHLYSHPKSRQREALLANSTLKAVTRLICEFCFCRFPTKTALCDHRLLKHQSSLFTCFSCDFSTAQRACLLRHLNQEHFHTEPEPESLKLAERSLSYDTSSSSDSSSSSSSDSDWSPYSDDLDSDCETKRLKRKHHLASVSQSDKHDVKAPKPCPSKTPSQHSNNNSVNSKPKTYLCQFCGKEFANSRVARPHMLDMHLDSLLSCPQCPHRSVSETQLERHVKREHRERRCADCSAVFTRRDRLIDHQVSAHQNYSGTLICEECGELVKSSSALTSHLEKHLRGPEVTCDEPGCEVRCKDYHRMLVHKKNVHRTPRYECSQCGKKSKNRSELACHMRVVHKGERRHACPWPGCDKRFADNYTMRIHHRRHTDEKPMSCCLCEYRCRQRASLTWHYRKQHAEYPEPELRALEKRDRTLATE